MEENEKEENAEIEIKVGPAKKIFKELDELYKQIEREGKNFLEKKKEEKGEYNE